MNDVARSIFDSYTKLSNDLAEIETPGYYRYFPLSYATDPWRQYLSRYGDRGGRILWVGINPGPWGMVQTGVPFGDVESLRSWLFINASVQSPPSDSLHPKKPVHGFACTRKEVSGRRLWSMLQRRYRTADNFFSRHFLLNHCPAAYCDAQGRNVTPFQLRRALRDPILSHCDRTLEHALLLLDPPCVIAVGRTIARHISYMTSLPIHTIPHPSPANPQSHHNWEERVCGILDSIAV